MAENYLNPIMDSENDTTLENAIVSENEIAPDDDPQLAPILPSQLSSAEKIPSEHTMTMSQALRQYRLTQDVIERLSKKPERGFWENAALGLGDFVRETKALPDKFDATIIRAFDGHLYPDMTEEQATRLMESATRYVSHNQQMRDIVARYEGADNSVIRPLFSGAAQVGAYAAAGLLTGGLSVGIMAGAQATADLSQEMAEQYLEEHGDMSDYKGHDDAIFALAHGAVSGWIEQRLGVERLFNSAMLKKGLGTFGKTVLGNAVGEAAEEYLQETSAYLFANMAGRNNRTFGEYQRDALTNAVYGAILGGAFSGVYYAGARQLQKSLKAGGLSDEQAKEVSQQMIDDAKESALNEIYDRAQIREHYGEQWDKLQNKIVNALENAGWKESHKEVRLQKYAEDAADSIVAPLFKMSNKWGIDTRDLLELSEIKVIDNVIYLDEGKLGTPEDIAESIKQKKAEYKSLSGFKKMGVSNENIENKKKELKAQIEILQKLHENKTGERVISGRRTRAAKARQDAEILASTAPAVSETIDSIDVSKMSSGTPTQEIRQRVDGRPFVYVGGKQLPVEYKVMPMSDIIASHIGQDVNPNYSLKELQNRAQRGSRTDVSILQSRAAKIQPENMGVAYNTQNGAPIVNEKGEVIAGNGRYEVLRMTDEKGRERYNKYLETLGFDTKGIKDPILVRVMQGLTPEQQIAVADASNVSETSAFDNASQAVQDAKLLKDTADITDFMNKIPVESRQGLFLANDRVNQVALARRYNDALMMWLLDGDVKTYESLYLMGGISQKVQTTLNQSIPQLMALANEYPDVSIRSDLAAALRRLPEIAKTKDFAGTISQAEITDGRPELFNENVLLYALNFGKNTRTWQGTGAERTQVGLTLNEFFDSYVQMARTNRENVGKTDLFGQPMAAERTRADMLAETLTMAFPREFEDGTAKSRDLRAVFLTRAQTAPETTQLNQIDLRNEITPSLFPADTSTASAVQNLPWEHPVNVSNPIFFSKVPDATDIELAKQNGYDAFLVLNQKDIPTQLVLLDGTKIGLKSGEKIPTGAELYKVNQQPNLLFQEQIDLANENARLDAENPAYTGDTININGIDKTVFNSNGDRIAQSEAALRNFYNWFGDSKVVDNKGRPLVVYHGTKDSFDEFKLKTGHRYDSGHLGTGFYFTNEESSAQNYSKWKSGDKESKVLSLYMKLENPLNLEHTERFKSDVMNALGIQLEERPGYFGITTQESDKITAEAKRQGYDGIIAKSVSNELVFVVYESNQIKSTENKGTFSQDTGNIYAQGTTRNGFYDPELDVIVLGSNSNTGTLPHEMAHYWATKIFDLVKSGKYNENLEFMSQAMGMFKMLGVGMNQTKLTREQQEQFATTTEAVIFGLAPVPEGMKLPITAFLNWVPEKYKSIDNIGYVNNQGQIVNPILDKYAVEWFNAWYDNNTLPSIGVSPLMTETKNPEVGDRTLPSATETMQKRESEMAKETDRLEKQQEQTKRDIALNTPASETAAMDAARIKIESRPDNMERSEPPEQKKRGITSYLIPGRRTNTREGMFEAAYDYIAKNREHAAEIAYANPNEVPNDTGIDRAILIRALMKGMKEDSPEYLQLYHNLAETVSLAGKTSGLSNDMNFQFYLEAVRRISDGLEGRAALKYAGGFSLTKARRTFNSDIDAFIQERAERILNARNDNDYKVALEQMMGEAVAKFKGDSGLLFQLDLAEAKRARGAGRNAFNEYAKRKIKEAIGAELTDETKKEIQKISEKAQKATDSLNSENVAEVKAAAKIIGEWQEYVAKKGIPQTWLGRIIGEWYPKAMLFNVSSHVINFAGNTPQNAIIRSALAMHYKDGNKVSKAVLNEEKERLMAVYKASGISLAGMANPTSDSLLHGEIYKPTGFWGSTLWAMGWEDSLFRNPIYVDALGRIATRDAIKEGKSPTELFKLYKRLDNPKNSQAYKARMEALGIAQISVFQQDGTLAHCVMEIRKALNFGQPVGLGTILIPFAKTPSNIVQQGIMSVVSPLTAGWHAYKGTYSIQDTINLGTMVLGYVLAAAVMCGDYEPPYEPGKAYDPDKPYDSIQIPGTDFWIKLDTFGTLSVPMRILSSLITGKGLGIAGSINEIPGWSAIADAYKQTQGFENKPGETALRFTTNLAYNRVNTAVPAVIRQVIAAAHLADLDLDEIDLGLPKTGIGRKIGRQYGLAGGDTTTNDILRIFFNRLRIAAE